MKRAQAVREMPKHALGRELYEHVRKSGAIFDLLREVTLDGLFYRDLTRADHEWTDERLWQLLGYEQTEGRPASREAQLLPEDRATAQRELLCCAEDPRRTYDCVLRYRHRDGATVWVRCRGLVLRDAHGAPVRLLGTHTDLSELQRARMAENELSLQRAREQVLRELIEGLPQLVWTCTPQGACDYLSPQWVEYTGIAESEQLGSAWLAQVHAEDQASLARAWTCAVSSGQPLDTEFRIRRHDGAYRWFKTRASPLRGEDGTIARWLGTNTDIHERKQLEETLHERTAALERSNSELEEFAYLASHDLQEPLRTVTSYVQLLERHYGGQLDDRAREYIEHAVSGARRMRRLVTDLLEYSRAIADPAVPSCADGTAALDSALEAVMALVTETGARVLRVPLPWLAIDEASLSRVLQNLLSNALHYRSQAPPRIELSCEVGSGQALLAVSDNGIGIAPQHHRRIFQMFQRLHTQGERPGTGVGLALCKRLVERAGGQIWLDSELGRGSTFFVRLPLAGAEHRTTGARS